MGEGVIFVHPSPVHPSTGSQLREIINPKRNFKTARLDELFPCMSLGKPRSCPSQIFEILLKSLRCNFHWSLPSHILSLAFDGRLHTINTSWQWRNCQFLCQICSCSNIYLRVDLQFHNGNLWKCWGISENLFQACLYGRRSVQILINM